MAQENGKRKQFQSFFDNGAGCLMECMFAGLGSHSTTPFRNVDKVSGRTTKRTSTSWTGFFFPQDRG